MILWIEASPEPVGAWWWCAMLLYCTLLELETMFPSPEVAAADETPAEPGPIVAAADDDEEVGWCEWWLRWWEWWPLDAALLAVIVADDAAIAAAAWAGIRIEFSDGSIFCSISGRFFFDFGSQYVSTTKRGGGGGGREKWFHVKILVPEPVICMCVRVSVVCVSFL